MFKRKHVGWFGSVMAANSTGRTAGGLAHEVGHKFRGAHNAGYGDCLTGARSCVSPGNLQLMLRYFEEGNEKLSPGLHYNGQLPPYAMEDYAIAEPGLPTPIHVLDNDFDGNGDELSVLQAGPKSKKGGRVRLAPDRKKVTYTSPRGFVGVDSFSYTVIDATGIANRTGNVRVDVRHRKKIAVYLPMDKMAKKQLPVLGSLPTQASLYAIKTQLRKGIVGQALFNTTLHQKGYLYAHEIQADPGPGDLSVSLWVHYPNTASLEKSGVLICKGADIAGSTVAGNALSGWSIGHLDEGKGFRFKGNIFAGRPEQTFALESRKPIQPNQWYHLVAVLDRKTKKLQAYLNNKPIVSSSANIKIPDGVIATQHPLMLFNGYNWKAGRSTSAMVDEVRIYTTALMPNHIQTLYDAGRNGKAVRLNLTTRPEKPLTVSPAARTTPERHMR